MNTCFKRSAKRSIIILALTMTSVTTILCQNLALTGTIRDKSNNDPIIGAYIIVRNSSDSADFKGTVTDANGRFIISGLHARPYKFIIKSINYQNQFKDITLSRSTADMGIIYLEAASRSLKEVVVVGHGTVVQKGDTTTMLADAFKVNVDATAEDLVKKMPGITVDNGTIKARGEEVKQVLVDGKTFFGDDPTVALKNLPADVIDRVQVYNKLSDQAELTGFDDGQSTRTINLITRKESKISSFGKFSGGTDFSSKYLVSGNLNVFRGPRRLSFTGMSNNINQQNFAMQDLIGSSSGGGGRGGMGERGGFGGKSFGGSSGISKNSSLGLNYQDNWGKKISVSGSYFFNTTTNTKITESNTEYLLVNEGKYTNDSSYARSENYNHRFNLRIEYQIDSLNSIILVPRFSLQDNSSDNLSASLITGGSVNKKTLTDSRSDALGYNFGNDLIWRHKFMKPGRTLSFRSSVSYDSRTSDNMQLATINDIIPDNQYTGGSTNNLSVNTSLIYTEPIGKNSQLQLNFNNGFRRSNNSNEIYATGTSGEILNMMDSLSSVYDNNYITNSGGFFYLFRRNKLNLSAGLNYQSAKLDGTQTFPIGNDVSEEFRDVLPNVMINYRFSDMANLRAFYRTSTNAPAVTQLQNAIDNSDRTKIKTGNPNLKQEYSQNFMSNFSYANATTGFNTFIFLSGSYTKDIITNKTVYAEGDTIRNPEGVDVTLYPGDQLIYPVNLDHSMNLNTMFNFSYYLKLLKSNASLVLGGGYSQTPEFVESQINRSNSYSLTQSFIITSNVSSNIDFTISYTSNYTIAKNSVELQEDTKYWYQSANAKLNLVLWKGITFNTDVVGQYNRGLSEGYNEKYLVWNASIGKKFLKSKSAELKISGYDLLNQNNNINRTVSASKIQDTKVNTYKRYFMIVFTYNLRAKRNQQQFPRFNDFPGGMPPAGMPPGGMEPGGMEPGGMPSGGMPIN
jgi:hypothetical protein